MFIILYKILIKHIYAFVGFGIISYRIEMFVMKHIKGMKWHMKILHQKNLFLIL